MNAIHIQQLRFKGGESQRRMLIADLDRVAWPTLSEREFLFIKRLHAQQAPAQLAGSLAKQAFDYRATAVSGWQNDAENHDAVYFATHAELLACLCRDLLQHKYCWYWQQWADWFEQSVQTALPACWRQQPALIPAIVQQLSQRQWLAWFCRQLSDTLAQQLCHLVCPQIELSALQSPFLPQSDKFNIPAGWLQPWQSVFSAEAFSLPVMQLASLLILKQWQPLALWQGDAQRVGQQILTRLMNFADAETGIQPIVVDRQELQKHTDRLEVMAAKAAILVDKSNITLAPFVADKTAPEPAAVQTCADVPDMNPSHHHSPRYPQHLPLSAETECSTSWSTPQAEPDTHDGSFQYQERFEPAAMQRLVTGQGGVFYLLNFLNLPQVQQSLLNDPVSSQYPSAFGWLWRLAVELGCTFDEVLLKLLAFYCGYEQAEQLQQLPAWPQLPQLLAWGRQRYGQLLFNQELFAVQAVLEIDASHIEVCYSLDAVRLDVRRAGLDIDPGWLPWLGKVVRFHYGALPVL